MPCGAWVSAAVVGEAAIQPERAAARVVGDKAIVVDGAGVEAVEHRGRRLGRRGRGEARRRRSPSLVLRRRAPAEEVRARRAVQVRRAAEGGVDRGHRRGRIGGRSWPRSGPGRRWRVQRRADDRAEQRDDREGPSAGCAGPLTARGGAGTTSGAAPRRGALESDGSHASEVRQVAVSTASPEAVMPRRRSARYVAQLAESSA